MTTELCEHIKKWLVELHEQGISTETEKGSGRYWVPFCAMCAVLRGRKVEEWLVAVE